MTDNFTGKTFSDLIADELGVPKTKAHVACKATFAALIQHVSKGGRVAIGDVGSFTLTTRKARTGRNPRTGETVQIEAKTNIKFKAAKSVATACNPPKKAKKK